MLKEVLENVKNITNITNESSLSRIYKHTLEHDSGTITAFRSARDCNDGEKYTNKENRKNNAILKAKLLKKGYGVTSIQGIGIENFKSDNEIEVKEQSFIVIDLKDKGTLKKDLIKLGTEFEQDAITFSVKGGKSYVLIGTNDCPNGYPGKGKVDKLGRAIFGDDGEFFSKVKGRPFVFVESASEHRLDTYKLDTYLDYFPSEMRSITALSEMSCIK